MEQNASPQMDQRLVSSLQRKNRICRPSCSTGQAWVQIPTLLQTLAVQPSLSLSSDGLKVLTFHDL
jgi:hypothetical protein